MTAIGQDARDRAMGALLGLAVGDAVGTTLEFQARDSYEPLTDMVGGGAFRNPPGGWTDDTSMALCLADSLAACGGLDEADLMRRFVRWWRDGENAHSGRCDDIGNTTRAALARFERSSDPIAGSTEAFAAGNGSIMRLAPAALFNWNDPDAAAALAVRQSRVTHAAREALDACDLLGRVLTALIGGAGLDAAFGVGAGRDYAPNIAAIAGAEWRDKHRDDIRSDGYVVHTLEAAFWCCHHAGGFRDAVLLAANLGDDADTTAAVAGQIAGAAFGKSGIPSEWLDRLLWRDRIEALAAALLHRDE